MPRKKFHLEDYQTHNDVLKQLTKLINKMLKNGENEENLYFDIEDKKFTVTPSKLSNLELIISVKKDELIKLMQGEYREILERKGYEKYYDKIIEKGIEVSKDITPTYLKHRIPELFTIKNTKEIYDKFRNSTNIYVYYNVKNDEFILKDKKEEKKEEVYLFNLSRNEIVKILQMDLFVYISIPKK